MAYHAPLVTREKSLTGNTDAGEQEVERACQMPANPDCGGVFV